MAQDLPIIERRRIEAEILKQVYDILRERHGEVEARAVIAAAVRKSSLAQAGEFARRTEGGTSLQSFIDLQALWTAGDALEIEVRERSEKTFAFDVRRCRYAEMYKAMGLGEIGHLLSCNRDGTFCEGYDPKLKLTRTQTIMQGASHCDFRYRYED
ncbi:MAG: L-2-amino-thiazoline-4-carboxylic acid hydrolase [Alphaproteobacteria bacterium]|nr:L-2-amino-thiazoline-4-carboxylic acid hydrolase [Alphaproteobacteria bacterium]